MFDTLCSAVVPGFVRQLVELHDRWLNLPEWAERVLGNKAQLDKVN